MPKSRKAINFDLDYNKLKLYYDSKHPNRAYYEIEKYMLSHGFEHRQYSGYVSAFPLRADEVASFTLELSKSIPWIHKCVKHFDVTEVKKMYDLTEILNTPYIIDEDELDNIFVVENDEQFKLIDLRDGSFELQNFEGNVIGITDCDNIEDAIDDIKQQSADLEI